MKRTVAILIALLGVHGVLYAHVYLLKSSPAPEAVLDEAPKKVTTTFVGSVEPAFSKIEVFSPDGAKVSGKTTFLKSDTIMEVELKEDLVPGEYKVKWVCLSLDGHKQTGDFVFTIE